MKAMSLRWSISSLVLASLFLSVSRAGLADDPVDDAYQQALKGLAWRSIGPADMGGRVVDIAGVAAQPSTVYMASASGGLWKTTNNGTTWRSIFESGNTLSLGAVAVAPSDSNVVYVGTGEHNPRNSASIGDGVYKSVDGGKTWKHLGLKDTEKIARIRIHPSDPDTVLVAVLGHEWGPNPDRGVFRSKDGGTTWEKVLYVTEDTGASDLSMDPRNPRILFAGLYDFRRVPWHYRSGGPGSGLYRSTDGGDTWTHLTDPEKDIGLPKGVLGRIAVAVAPSRPNVVYAMMESEKGILWRSDDGGDTWRLMTDERGVNARPFYYTDIRVDPSNENRIYSVSGRLSVSDDGGKTWKRIAENIHGDHQALWIDPEDPNHLIDGNDGGWAFSYDRGETWNFVNTVPLGQFYQIGADMREPYTVCGGLQDNDVWCGPSKTWTVTGILENDWYEIHGPGDGMYVQIDPNDHTNIYTNSQAGNIVHVNLATGEARSIHPYPVPLSGSAAGDHPYRFNWNAPIHMSPHDPNVIYFGSNVLFKTTDGGETWVAVSPDLTTNDPEKLKSSGGPITADNTSAEYHCTIFTIAESPVAPGVIWVGTDDGNVQLTRDGGRSWLNLAANIHGLPTDSWVSRIEASRVDGGTAYVSFDRHQVNDPAPYVFKTADYGRTWKNITDNLPPLHYVHVVREDPKNSSLIYVGTELGIFASWTGGGKWRSIRLNLPPVAVRDILVHPRDNDLIIGTHGRSIWILDDIAPLQRLDQAMGGEFHLFPVRSAVRYVPWKKRFRADIGDQVFIGENPPFGALITYYLKEDLKTEEKKTESAEKPSEETKEPTIKIEVLDGHGDVLRTLEGPAKAGIHRVAWDLRGEPLPKLEEKGVFRFEMNAPMVLPGTYRVKLGVPDKALEEPVDVRTRPDKTVSKGDLQAQHEAVERLLATGKAGSEAVRVIDDMRPQLQGLIDRLGKQKDAPQEILEQARRLDGDLKDLRGEMASADELTYETPPRLLDKIRALARDVESSDARPTAAQSEWVDRFAAEFEKWMGRYRRLVDEEVAGLNRKMDEAGVPRIFLSGR